MEKITVIKCIKSSRIPGSAMISLNSGVFPKKIKRFFSLSFHQSMQKRVKRPFFHVLQCHRSWRALLLSRISHLFNKKLFSQKISRSWTANFASAQEKSRWRPSSSQEKEQKCHFQLANGESLDLQIPALLWDRHSRGKKDSTNRKKALLGEKQERYKWSLFVYL